MLNTEMDIKSRIRIGISNFLNKYKIVLLVLLIAIIVFIVGYFIWTELYKRDRENSTVLVEKAQGLYQDWQENEDSRESIEEELNELLERIIKNYPHKYAAQRAYFIHATMAFEQEDWETAVNSYLKLAELFPCAYLAPLSMLNAGVCREELDDPDGALIIYQKVTEQYEDSFIVPHVIFSIGRINEHKEDFKNALVAYNKLEDEYPFSNWTKLGRNRIIDIKVKGTVQE